MLLKNINQTNNFCNDTRFRVNYLGRKAISTIVIINKNINSKIFKLIINLTPYSNISFKFHTNKFILINSCIFFNKLVRCTGKNSSIIIRWENIKHAHPIIQGK